MIDTVEAAVEIILIIAPGDTCHDVNAISLALPLGDTSANIGTHAVAHCDVRAKLEHGIPMSAGLEARALLRLAGIGGSRGCFRHRSSSLGQDSGKWRE